MTLEIIILVLGQSDLTFLTIYLTYLRELTPFVRSFIPTWVMRQSDFFTVKFSLSSTIVSVVPQILFSLGEF